MEGCSVLLKQAGRNDKVFIKNIREAAAGGVDRSLPIIQISIPSKVNSLTVVENLELAGVSGSTTRRPLIYDEGADLLDDDIWVTGNTPSSGSNYGIVKFVRTLNNKSSSQGRKFSDLLTIKPSVSGQNAPAHATFWGQYRYLSYSLELF